jgi:type I restriction enzyme S subunit
VTRPLAKLESLAASKPYALIGGPFGSKLTSPDYVEEGGIPVIRGSNLNGGRYLDESEFVYVSEQKMREDLFGNLAHPGDIVFTQRGTLGQVALIPPDSKFDTYVISQSQMKLTVDSQKVDPRFIYYFFSSREGIQQIVNQNSSSGVPHINLTSLRKFSLPVPPLKEQQRIADILSAYDDLIENNQRRIALLEEAARMLYREWFVRFRFPGHEHVKIIDGVPELWKPHTLAHVCDAVGGGTPSTDKREYWDGGDIPWFTPTDVTRNACLALLDSEKRITESGLRGSSAKMLPAGTVLMTSRASVGFFGIVQVPSCTNQGFINIVPHKPNMRMYLLHNLMSRVEEIRSHAGGATYKEISKGKFKTLRVLVPDDSLLREFEELTTTFHAQVRTLHRASYKLAEARDLLLPRLMNGQIAV